MSEAPILFAVQPGAVEGLAPQGAARPALPAWARGRGEIWANVRQPAGWEVRRARVPLHPARRAAARRDFRAFVAAYFPEMWRRFENFHHELAGVLERLVLGGGVQKVAAAAPRGVGKTTLTRVAVIWALLYRHRRMVLFIAKNNTEATNSLSTIKGILLRNDLLHEDFPEICAAVRDFGGDPRAAPTGYPWGGEMIKLRNDTFAICRGVEAQIRGINIDTVRPDFVIGDDLETKDSASSETETNAIRSKIDADMSYLHALGQDGSYLILCTLVARHAVCAELTDPKKRPDWNGRIWRAVVKKPERVDLWDSFREIAQGMRGYEGEQQQINTENSNGEGTARTAENGNGDTATELGIEGRVWESLTGAMQTALAFYADNKAEMDFGAELLAPGWLPLWQYYAMDEASAEQELNNNPGGTEAGIDLQLDASTLAARRSGRARGVPPPWAGFLTASVDMGQYRLHWEIDAWTWDGSRAALVDCGIEATGLDSVGQYTMADGDQKLLVLNEALGATLARLQARFAAAGVARAGVDTGGAAGGQDDRWAWNELVMRFCAGTGRVWLPLKGKSPWSDSAGLNAGRNWNQAEESNPFRLILCNTDFYKRRNVDALSAGTRELPADVPGAYLKHMQSEHWVQSFHPDKAVKQAIRTGWRQVDQQNHWFDTAWMGYCVAEIHMGSVRAANAAGTAKAPAGGAFDFGMRKSVFMERGVFG